MRHEHLLSAEPSKEQIAPRKNSSPRRIFKHRLENCLEYYRGDLRWLHKVVLNFLPVLRCSEIGHYNLQKIICKHSHPHEKCVCVEGWGDRGQEIVWLHSIYIYPFLCPFPLLHSVSVQLLLGGNAEPVLEKECVYILGMVEGKERPSPWLAMILLVLSSLEQIDDRNEATYCVQRSLGSASRNERKPRSHEPCGWYAQACLLRRKHTCA